MVGVLAEDAEGVAHGIADAAGRVVVHDHYIGGGLLQGVARNGQQGTSAGGGSHGAIQHQAGQQHRQQAADYLAGLDPADGQLDDDMACVDQQQDHLNDDEVQIRQQLGGHQLHQQHQTADHQQGHSGPGRTNRRWYGRACAVSGGAVLVRS